MVERIRSATRATWRRSLTPNVPLTWVEGAVCLLVLLVLTAVVYGSHVSDGNFYSDDWANSSDYHHSADPRFWNTFDTFWSKLGGRPLLALFLAIPHAVFGTNPTPHIVLGLTLATLACAAFYLLLRELGLAQLHAGIVASLALLFPWSDSTRLWPTATINNVAVLLYLLGTVLALRGLRSTQRVVTVRQGAAVLLVALSALTYEAAGVVALLSVLLYSRVTTLPAALRRWAIDLVVIGGILIWSARETAEVRYVGIETSVSNIPRYAGDAVSILGQAFRPFGAPWWALVAIVALLALAVVRRAPLADAGREQARRWGLIAAGAAFGVAAAYAPFLGYELFPLRGGIYNRGNLLAALPFALLIYALAMIGGSIVFANARRWRTWSLAFSLAVVALVGLGFLDRLATDKRQWRQASELESQAVATLKSTVPDLPPGSTIYTFNYPAQVAPGVPIFSDTWDLQGAVRINWDDRSLAAYPIFEQTRFVCGERRTHPVGGEEFYFLEDGYGREQSGSYGRVLAVDLRTGEVHRISSQQACRKILSRMTPGVRYLAGPEVS